ncbi:uncharacterized protein LOC26534482 [Drosophila yakuba]|uniref:Uncharacterized protein n=1 Tax=Drosophila yakuba TaxID=7245 RepID=A0A0R1E4T9_DROYA|nr:uncharacterized protein LOC26534482 [Drosophila yakuba]KRK02327.1 uncharacterized protein Dyak_GE27301 [Drosophila yakuba]
MNKLSNGRGRLSFYINYEMKFFVLLIYICSVFKCGHPINLKNFFTSTTPYSLADHVIAFPVCANCTSEKHFRTTTDFYCHYEDDSSIEERVRESGNMYADCLPDQFIMTRNIQWYCCFRSPELGCSALIGRKFYDKKIYSCKTCKRFCSGTKQTYVNDPDGSNEVLAYGSLVLLAFLVLCTC